MDDECVYAVSVDPASCFSATHSCHDRRIMSATIYTARLFYVYKWYQRELTDLPLMVDSGHWLIIIPFLFFFSFFESFV